MYFISKLIAKLIVKVTQILANKFMFDSIWGNKYHIEKIIKLIEVFF